MGHRMLGMKTIFFLAFLDYRKKNCKLKSLTNQTLLWLPHNKNEGVPIFLVEMDNFDLVEGDDVHDPTTTIQGWCALATDTPTPRIAAFLWCAIRPRGHSSCKQSKNKQEHNEQSQLQNIYILSFQSEITRWWGSVYNQTGGLSNTRAERR